MKDCSKVKLSIVLGLILLILTGIAGFAAASQNEVQKRDLSGIHLDFGGFVSSEAQGGTTQTSSPSISSQTPSLVADLLNNYDITNVEAVEITVEYGSHRIKFAMENSTTLREFYLYLESPDSMINVDDSCVTVEFSHPRTGKPLTDVKPNISIVTDQTKNLVLVGQMTLSGNTYRYCVDSKKWLVQPDPGSHVLFVDVGKLKHVRTQVKVAEDGTIKKLENDG